MEAALPTCNPNSVIELDLVNANADNHNSGLMRESIALIRDIENQIKGARLSEKSIDLIELNLNLGDVYVNIRNYEKANHVYSEAIHLSRQIGDSSRYHQASYKLVQMFDISTDINKSLSYLFHYLDESKKLGDRQKICETYYNISKLYAIIGNEELYLKYCKYYSTLSRELNPDDILSQTLDEMDVLWTILKTAKNTNDYVSNIDDRSTQAEPMNFDRTLNPICSWHDYNFKGIQLYHMKKYHIATKFFFRGFPEINYWETMTSNMAYKFWKAESFVKIGSCLRELNQLQDAVSYFKRILDLEDDLFTTMSKFSAYCQLEICYQRMSENADEYTQEKTAIMKKREWSLIQKKTLAEIYYFSGNYLEALRVYQEIVEESAIHYNRLHQFLAICNIGHTYFAAGDLVEALRAYQSVRNLVVNSKRSGLASVLYNMYQIHYLRKDLTLAKVELNAYLTLSIQTRDSFGKCMGYESMSDLLKQMNDFKGAYAFAEKYLKCVKIVGDRCDVMCAQKSVEQLNRFLQDVPETGQKSF